ncbi:PBP1A family penicillin-binding protein [bacterium]|nr:PBP1A family penicillin-binding protein [bacterium]
MATLVRKSVPAVVVVLAVLAVMIIGTWSFIAYLKTDLPSVEELENINPALATKILDRNGVLIKELFTQRRSYVPLRDMPPEVIQAFLATEDHKFYDHWGMRPAALGVAILKAIVTLDLHPRGASTITQQLAKNLYFGPQRKITRKLRELLTAVEIERYYSKDEILEMYLTQTYFGAGAYGIGAAAATYFSKSVPELNVNEAATLAAIPKSPTRYNPLQNPQNTLVRRNLVFGRMEDVGYITKAERDSLVDTPLPLHPSMDRTQEGIAPYFTENVRQELNRLGDRHGFDPLQDGLTVYTTLDAKLQKCAEDAVAKVLPELQDKVNEIHKITNVKLRLKEMYPDSNTAAIRRLASNKRLADSIATAELPVQVAFVALDPATGHILAMIGGRSFELSKFNRATQAVRQPGSCFKPFVYASAIDKGMPISEKVSNDEIVVTLENGDLWAPKNFSDEYGGIVDLRQALAKSLNVVSVRLIREHTNPRDVVELARGCGITTKLDPYDALALGASGVIPLDIVGAYQVFQTLGIWSKPIAVTGLDDQFGQTIEQFRNERKVVMSEETAFLVQSLMRSVSDHGTAASLRSKYEFRIPTAGKTGTTNDNTDAWFIGFTPHLLAGVWVGLDDPAKSLGRGQEGGKAALPIWAEFMLAAYQVMDYPESEFRVPRGITTADICVESGELATSGCDEIRTEYFASKSELPESCTIHGAFRTPRGRKQSLF